MAWPRAGHSATLLSNGELLLNGGTGRYGDASRFTELYNPVAGSRRSTGDLFTSLIGVQFATATLLPTGKVLLAGGYDGEGGAGGPTASAQLYDPTTRLWSLTGSLSSPRANPSATLLPNGEVLIVGGMSN